MTRSFEVYFIYNFLLVINIFLIRNEGNQIFDKRKKKLFLGIFVKDR